MNFVKTVKIIVSGKYKITFFFQSSGFASVSKSCLVVCMWRSSGENLPFSVFYLLVINQCCMRNCPINGTTVEPFISAGKGTSVLLSKV
jgi:hypothetical protein